MRYSARRPEVADPTADIAVLSELVTFAREWANEASDDAELSRRYELIADLEYDLVAQAADPNSGRGSQLDEAFSVMGYRNRDSDY